MNEEFINPLSLKLATHITFFYCSTMRPSRSRRRDKRAALSPRRYSTVIVLSIFLFLALVLLRIDVDSEDQSYGTEESERSCAESCQRELSSEYQMKNSRSQDDTISLTSSAVDAMFTIRISPDVESNGSLNNSAGWTDSQKYEEQYRIRDVSYDYMASKPRRIPPLIQSLVGAHSYSDGSGNLKNNRPIIIPPPKRSQYRYADELKGATDSQNIYAESSVAKVAAAAAAVWLEDEGNLGRSNGRMKGYNEEWDGALRWISTWGQYHHNSHHESSIDTSSHNVPREAGVSRDRGVRAQRIVNEDQDRRRNRRDASDFDRAFNMCTKKCRRRQNSSNDSIQGNQITPLSSGIGTSEMISFLLRIRLSQKSILEIFSRQLTRNVIGIVLSTAIIWMLRNANDWWKLNRYTATLQQLLREESEASASNVIVKKYRHRTNHKKQKKKRSKRDHRSLTNPHDKIPLEDKTEWSGEENKSDSDDSFHRMYRNHTGLRRHANTMDSYSDQASKGTISTASYTTIDSQSYATTRASKQGIRSELKRLPSHEIIQPKTPPPPRSYPVPTESQREAAHRSLKMFQEMKLKELVKYGRKLEKTNSVRIGTKLTMKEVVMKNLPREANLSDVKAHIGTVSLPPGFSQEDDTKSRASQNQSPYSHLFRAKSMEDDVDLMISNILDDDDFNVVVSHRNDCQTNFTNDASKSVALGDLLAPSSFCSTPSPSSRSAVNPWSCLQRKDDSNSTSLQNVLSHEGNFTDDANTRLQVSAAEFLPSWGKVESDSSPTIR